MTPELKQDIDSLRNVLRLGHSPSPWEFVLLQDKEKTPEVIDERGFFVATCATDHKGMGVADARFIAVASPARVRRIVDALEAALSQAEADRVDAERYRWQLENPGPWHAWSVQKTGEKNLSAAIDAARKASPSA